MKKFLNILALAAILAVPSVASAQSKWLQLDPLKWDRGASEDSVWISIPVWGGSVATATAEDTTKWLDLAPFAFPEGTTSATTIPLVSFAVSAQVTTGAGAITSDSLGYVIQYTNDRSLATRTTGFQGVALAYNENVGGTACWLIHAVTSARTNTASGRWVRLIVRNAEVGSGTQRRFSVVPIIHGRRD